jgi:2TM domain
METRLSDRDIERMARRSAGARLGWYIHAGVYVVITTALGLLSAMGGKGWAVYPALGWGAGVVIHGLVVFFLTDGRGVYERLVQQERERLSLQRDPW